MKKLILFSLLLGKLSLAVKPVYLGVNIVLSNGNVCLDSISCNNFVNSDGTNIIINTGGALELYGNGVQRLQLNAGALLVGASGVNLTWNTDGAGSIGATGAHRPTNIFNAGDFYAEVIGKTYHIAEGTNGCTGQGALVGGTVTISTTCTPATSDGIFVTDAGGGVLANIGSVAVGAVSSAVSFVVNSSNALDTSNVNWMIIKH